MSIMREYYDDDGNYWQIETPRYIPPKEAIKNPSFVRGCIMAEDSNEDEKDRSRYGKSLRNVDIIFAVIQVAMMLAMVMKV